MASQRFDIVIIGAGIVGLATAREALTRRPRARLMVIEKENRVAAHQSGRNSGVIHSGLYYRPGSIKAATCVSGRAELLAFCRDEEIPHAICGKVVVAIDAREAARLEELRRRGAANGVQGLAIIDAGQLREIEPHAGGIAALHVPGAGITDFGAVARRFAAIVQQGGGVVRTGARVIALRRTPAGMVVETTGGDVHAARVINCAGLHCDRIAAMAGASLDLDIIPFRGEYLSIAGAGRQLVRGLLYRSPIRPCRFSACTSPAPSMVIWSLARTPSLPSAAKAIDGATSTPETWSRWPAAPEHGGCCAGTGGRRSVRCFDRSAATRRCGPPAGCCRSCGPPISGRRRPGFEPRRSVMTVR